MRRILIRRSLFVFLAAFTSAFVLLAAFTSADDEHDDDGHREKSKTFTVLVGAEDTSVGASVVGFFPETVTIHVGDTVHWQRNANEVHTVTFLAGTPLPPVNIPAPPGLPSPLMRNPVVIFPTAPPDGQYDGTTYANSGIFGPDPDIFQGVESFDLTFTKPGTYDYLCIVHGPIMSGRIIVLDHPGHVRAPSAIAQEARRAIAEALAQVPAALAQANGEVPAPTDNPDGTTTYHPRVGFRLGQLDLLSFFPNQLTVHPGDTVEWIWTAEHAAAPHTISLLNGNPDIPLLLVVPQPSGPPLLVLNPEFLFPKNAGQPLTREGVYSSGRLIGPPSPSFSLKIGDISGEEPYQCLIHDSSGMLGTLEIVPR